MTEYIAACLPEIIISVFICINLLGALFFNKNLYKWSKWITLVGIVIALCSTIYLQIEPEILVFDDTFLTNVYTVFFKILILISAFFLTLLSRNLIREKRDKAFEYFSVFLSAVLFSMCAVSSVNFLTLFVSIEAFGLCNYLLLVFNKKNDIKRLTFGYFVQNAIYSAIFLMGLSFVYGMCANFDFIQVSACFAQNPSQVLLSFSLILMLCGLLFKLGVVPFSSWISAPFEGANAPIAAFLSTVPVVMGFGILARLLMMFLNFTFSIKLILAFVSVATIIFGSLSAIRQENLKRLMANSMSLQSGIMLLGLCVFSVYSLSGVLFYLFCYLFANIGAWAAIILLDNSIPVLKLEKLNGLLYHRPYYVVAFTIILIALAGLAPTCGFVAKLYLFSAVARSGVVFLPFLLIALLAIVIMIYAYWRVIRAMFKRIKTKVNIDTQVISQKYILYACALVTIFICIFADQIIRLCQLVAYYM